MKRLLPAKLLIYLLAFLLGSQSANAWIFERRTDQFKTDTSYAIIPIPYSIPGVGDGIGVGAGVLNIEETHIDTYVLGIFGDVEGKAIGFSDIHLIDKNLIFDIGYSSISKASFVINPSRGMTGDEDPKDFNVAEISDSTYYGSMLTLTFLERMIELSLRAYRGSSKLERIRDKEGKILVEYDDLEAEEATIKFGQFILDFTDDRHDPRNGFRYALTRDFPDKPDSDSAHFYTVDHNLTAYVPLLTNSTFVLNYFQSDAFVMSEGETDRTVIETKFLPCEAGDSDCEDAREQSIDQTVAANKYGSATSLGGLSRLRSFTNLRFRGSHTRFYGGEFRWNLTDEQTEFDILFMKDLRTSFQVAFFHEAGTIADDVSDLFEEVRHSTGVGFRVVMGSGLVYRLEYATGEEGGQTVLFLGYPWDFL